MNLQAVPGHPNVRMHDVEYAWPLAGQPAHVTQGWGGGTSHRDPASLHAVDLAAPAGTAVLAARDGMVMQVESRFAHGAADPRLEDRANFVRILHGDGTMALYAHLQPGGVLVAPGREVRAGDRIGLSGSTGYATGPHLHFAVQVNRGMQLVSIPFRMDGLPAGGQPSADEGLRTRSGPGW